MNEVKLVFLEHVFFSKQVPWDYDIYDICVKGIDEPVGKIVLRQGLDEALRYCGHVGYHIETEYQGHGYAAMALRELLKTAYRQGQKKLIITCAKNNIASMKTIEKMPVLSKRLETDIQDKEFDSPEGLWIYEIEVVS